jgi:transcription elongation GreA/GreB family factor
LAGPFVALAQPHHYAQRMDKRFLIEQLSEKLRESATVARKAGQAAADEARDGATAAEKRENARVAQEYSGLARGQVARASRAQVEISTLETFRPGPLPRGARIELGAIVEVEDEGMGRTFFLAPVGAGVELTGPGGDGFLSVVTPLSPVGKAVLGRRVGETVEVTVQGEPHAWTITYAT